MASASDPNTPDPNTPDPNAPDRPKDLTPLEAPPPLPAPFVTPDNLAGLVRRIRRIADLSQREFAARAGVSPSTVARIEAGSLSPSLGTLLQLLAVADLALVATDPSGNVIHPMQVWDNTRDGAERIFPAHLDLILEPQGEWWADIYGLARPPETFHRNRAYRDARRRRSQWEVRVAQFRHVPAPPDVESPYWRRRFGVG